MGIYRHLNNLGPLWAYTPVLVNDAEGSIPSDGDINPQQLTKEVIMSRQEKRIEKAIDELIKIKDDGYGNADLERILDMLWSLKCKFSDYWEAF